MLENYIMADPPAIRVYVAGDAGPEERFAELLHGIEEEGVPYRLEESDIADVKALSYEAAISSNLAVGLGITRDKAALHFEKLPADSPLYVIDREIDKNHLRDLGSNAARLVKRMPLNDIEQRRRESNV
jgi:hypothetical protein